MCQLVGPVRHSLLCLLLCGAPASAEEPWPVWHVWRTGHYKLYMIQNLGDIQRNLCSVTFVIHNSPPKHSSVQSRLFFFWDYFVFLLQREEFWSQHFTFLCHWLVGHWLKPTSSGRGQPALPDATLQRSQDHQCRVGASGGVCDRRTRERRDQPDQRQGEAAKALRSLGKLK